MTMRILHLLHPPSAGDAAIRRLRLLIAEDSEAHQVLLIGGSCDERDVHALGIDTMDRLSPPFGRPELAILPLRRFLRTRPAFDLIHAWSPDALCLAAHARPHVPLLATLGLPPDTRRSRVRHRLLSAASRKATLCFSNSWTRAAWFDQYDLAPLDERVIHNAMRPSGDDVSREQLREEWNVDDESLVILTGGDPVRRQPSRLLMYVAALSVYSGQPAAVILQSGARDLERTRRFDVHYGGPWQVIIDDRPNEDLLVGADVALWHHHLTGAESLGPPVGIDLLEDAAARGIPFVAGEHPIVDELRAAAPKRPHAERPIIDLIEQMLRIRKDPDAIRRETAAIRADVRPRHEPDRWLSSYRDVYRSLA